MNTSEVLNRAADVIERRGWTQGDWDIEDESAPTCLEGGIVIAAGLGRDEVGRRLLDVCPAARAVFDYLGLAEGAALWEWNDGWMGPGMTRVDRTSAEVIEVLRATAVIEAARESAAVRVSA